jgi:hypothetical protein
VSKYWLNSARYAPPAIGPQQYWRVRHLAVNTTSDPWPRIGELIFAASSGGSQLATGGTAIGSGTGFSIGRAFDKAFDGMLGEPQTTQFIAPTVSDYGFIGYNFGSPVSIGAVGVQASSASVASTVAGIAIEYSSDGVNWTVCEPSAPLLSWSTSEIKWTVIQPPVGNTKAQARIWRVANWTMVSGVVGWHKTFFRATSGGAQLATGGQHYGSNGTNGSVGPWRCFDGGTSDSLYGVLTSQAERFVQYIFPTPPNPAYFAITKPTSGVVAGDPASFDLQWSCDGVNFTTALSVSGLSSMSSGATQEWAIP